jgi:AraC-type DNA-binding domain-containing proteins
MITNIEEFCRLYYTASFIPITYYQSQILQVCSYPPSIDFLNLPGYFNQRLHELNKNPYYFITRSYSYLGIVKITNSNDFIIIGPLFSTPVTSEILKDFMNEYAISFEQQSAIAQILHNTPLISFNQFLNTLSFIHFSVNGLVIEPGKHFDITNSAPHQAISIQHSNKIYDAKEEQSYHNTYHFEQNYLDYIKSGKTEQLKAFLLNNGPTLKEGTIAPNALRQSKNIFIICTTLSTRSAIIGGLDIEQAYYLSDIYINECEKMQSIDAISNLQFAMITDFTERVAKNKISPDMSPEIFECVQFVNRHTNEAIRVDDVASHIGRSRSYISKKFKSELGFELGSFIMHCKLEEAKSLLTYSNKSLSEISSYLCFSSQAYFQNVFKKAYGFTPKQYRNQTKM